jgi:hypothetical protein
VIDGTHSSKKPAAARGGVSGRTTALVVVACGLVGYGFSLVLPLHTAPVVAAAEEPAAEPGNAAAEPASPPAPSRTAALSRPTTDVAPQPAPATPPQVASDVSPALAPGVQSSKIAARDAAPAEIRRSVAQPEPVAAPITPPPPVHTGSLALPVAAPKAEPVGPKAEPAGLKAEPSRSHARARQLRHKRIRRAYYRHRPAPSKPGNPVEALWSLVTK